MNKKFNQDTFDNFNMLLIAALSFSIGILLGILL